MFRTDLDACRTLFGASAVTRVDEYPVDLNIFANATYNLYGAPEEILTRYTVASFFLWTGRPPWHAGTRQLDALATRYGSGLLSHGASDQWRFCPDCCQYEVAHCGSSYWHRSHQLPCTRVCTDHRSALAHLPRAFPELHNRLYLPEDTTFVAGIITDSASMDLLCRLAKIEHAMLLDPSPVPMQVGLRAMLQGLDARGYLTNMRIDRRALSDALIDHVKPLSSQDCPWRELSTGAIADCVDALALGRYPGVRHFVILIDYLFGSWNAFKGRLLWEDVLDTQQEREQPPCASCERDTHRQACIELLDRYPQILRSGFARATPKSFRWLMKHDKPWLDAIFPVQRPKPRSRLL